MTGTADVEGVGRAGDVELLGAGVGFVVLLIAWLQPAWDGIVRLSCPLLALTGIACPTCGGTRALVAAARGDLLQAIAWNPMVGLAGLGLLLYVPWAAGATAGDWWRPRLPDRAGPALRALAVGGLLANWIYVAIRLA